MSTLLAIFFVILLFSAIAAYIERRFSSIYAQTVLIKWEHTQKLDRIIELLEKK